MTDLRKAAEAALDQALDGLRKRGMVYSEGKGMACRWYQKRKR